MPGSPLASSGHWGGVCPGPESPSRRQKSLTGYRSHLFYRLGLQAAPAGTLLTNTWGRTGLQHSVRGRGEEDLRSAHVNQPHVCLVENTKAWRLQTRQNSFFMEHGASLQPVSEHCQGIDRSQHRSGKGLAITNQLLIC